MPAADAQFDRFISTGPPLFNDKAPYSLAVDKLPVLGVSCDPKFMVVVFIKTDDERRLAVAFSTSEAFGIKDSGYFALPILRFVGVKDPKAVTIVFWYLLSRDGLTALSAVCRACEDHKSGQRRS